MIKNRDEYIEWANKIVKARTTNFRGSQEFTNLLLSEIASALWAIHDDCCSSEIPFSELRNVIDVSDLACKIWDCDERFNIDPHGGIDGQK